MNLGFDAKRLYSNFTGLGNYSRTLLRNLQTYFPEEHYHLYTPSYQRRFETQYFESNPAFRTVESSATISPYWRSFSISKQLRRDRISVYHGLSNELPFTIQKFGIKSVVTIHDLIFKSLPETYPFFDRKMYDLKFRRSCQIADKIIAISAYTKQDIIQVYQIDPAKIEVVYQACDPLFYEQDLPDQSLDFPLPSEFLLYVGSVIPRKNLKGVLEAYAIIPPSDRIPLVVVGGGSETYQQELQAIIQKHALQPFMIWKQNLADNRTLRSLYQKASALIYPSFYEGFGLPVTEALLSRTPAITSSVSSLPEAGGPDAGYVDPNDPEHIAHAIQEVLSDETLRQTMIEKGFAYARSTFDPQRLSQQMMEIYRSL